MRAEAHSGDPSFPELPAHLKDCWASLRAGPGHIPAPWFLRILEVWQMGQKSRYPLELTEEKDDMS
jgi:hypothetical protein